jgi:hypothetical protein
MPLDELHIPRQRARVDTESDHVARRVGGSVRAGEQMRGAAGGGDDGTGLNRQQAIRVGVNGDRPLDPIVVGDELDDRGAVQDPGTKLPRLLYQGNREREALVGAQSLGIRPIRPRSAVASTARAVDVVIAVPQQ